MKDKVYLPNRVGKEEDVPTGAEKTSFTIERAVLVCPPRPSSTNSDSLYLGLSKDNENNKENVYRYCMYEEFKSTNGVIAPFLQDMGICYSKSDKRDVAIEMKELEGKKLIGYFKVEENVNSFIKGVSVEENDLEEECMGGIK